MRNLGRYMVVIPLLLCGLGLFAQESAGMLDGPYVFYRNGKLAVYSVKSGSMGYTGDSVFSDLRAIHPLEVHLEGHPDWDFSVTLRDKSEVPPAVVTGDFGGKVPMLLLSDIEGEFAAFRELLLANKVIDRQYRWTFGKGHLVIAGDLFDRGKQVCAYLWLLYKLEGEAAGCGGGVDVVLGNHDVMNLGGDLRYVQPVYFRNAGLMGLDYRALYGTDTELGRWLRSKNIVERLGGFLVMHGGMSPALLSKGWSLEKINQLARPYYDRWMQMGNDSCRLLFGGSTAPFWYRGYFVEPKAENGLVDSTLAFYKCSHIVVGHTILERVSAVYGGKVIGVDVDEHAGKREGLLAVGGKLYRVDASGNRSELMLLGG